MSLLVKLTMTFLKVYSFTWLYIQYTNYILLNNVYPLRRVSELIACALTQRQLCLSLLSNLVMSFISKMLLIFLSFFVYSGLPPTGIMWLIVIRKVIFVYLKLFLSLLKIKILRTVGRGFLDLKYS